MMSFFIALPRDDQSPRLPAHLCFVRLGWRSIANEGDLSRHSPKVRIEKSGCGERNIRAFWCHEPRTARRHEKNEDPAMTPESVSPRDARVQAVDAEKREGAEVGAEEAIRAGWTLRASHPLIEHDAADDIAAVVDALGDRLRTWEDIDVRVARRIVDESYDEVAVVGPAVMTTQWK
jgi:hypothetical protein